MESNETLVRCTFRNSNETISDGIVFCLLSNLSCLGNEIAGEKNLGTLYNDLEWVWLFYAKCDSTFDFKLAECDNKEFHVERMETIKNFHQFSVPKVSADQAISIKLKWNSDYLHEIISIDDILNENEELFEKLPINSEISFDEMEENFETEKNEQYLKCRNKNNETRISPKIKFKITTESLDSICGSSSEIEEIMSHQNSRLGVSIQSKNSSSDIPSASSDKKSTEDISKVNELLEEDEVFTLMETEDGLVDIDRFLFENAMPNEGQNIEKIKTSVTTTPEHEKSKSHTFIAKIHALLGFGSLRPKNFPNDRYKDNEKSTNSLDETSEEMIIENENNIISESENIDVISQHITTDELNSNEGNKDLKVNEESDENVFQTISNRSLQEDNTNINTKASKMSLENDIVIKKNKESDLDKEMNTTSLEKDTTSSLANTIVDKKEIKDNVIEEICKDTNREMTEEMENQSQLFVNLNNKITEMKIDDDRESLKLTVIEEDKANILKRIENIIMKTDDNETVNILPISVENKEIKKEIIGLDIETKIVNNEFVEEIFKNKDTVSENAKFETKERFIESSINILQSEPEKINIEVTNIKTTGNIDRNFVENINLRQLELAEKDSNDNNKNNEIFVGKNINSEIIEVKENKENIVKSNNKDINSFEQDLSKIYTEPVSFVSSSSNDLKSENVDDKILTITSVNEKNIKHEDSQPILYENIESNIDENNDKMEKVLEIPIDIETVDTHEDPVVLIEEMKLFLNIEKGNEMAEITNTDSIVKTINDLMIISEKINNDLKTVNIIVDKNIDIEEIVRNDPGQDCSYKVNEVDSPFGMESNDEHREIESGQNVDENIISPNETNRNLTFVSHEEINKEGKEIFIIEKNKSECNINERDDVNKSNDEFSEVMIMKIDKNIEENIKKSTQNETPNEIDKNNSMDNFGDIVCELDASFRTESNNELDEQNIFTAPDKNSNIKDSLIKVNEKKNLHQQNDTNIMKINEANIRPGSNEETNKECKDIFYEEKKINEDSIVEHHDNYELNSEFYKKNSNDQNIDKDLDENVKESLLMYEEDKNLNFDLKIMSSNERNLNLKTGLNEEIHKEFYETSLLDNIEKSLDKDHLKEQSGFNELNKEIYEIIKRTDIYKTKDEKKDFSNEKISENMVKVTGDKVIDDNICLESELEDVFISQGNNPQLNIETIDNNNITECDTNIEDNALVNKPEFEEIKTNSEIEFSEQDKKYHGNLTVESQIIPNRNLDLQFKDNNISIRVDHPSIFEEAALEELDKKSEHGEKSNIISIICDSLSVIDKNDKCEDYFSDLDTISEEIDDERCCHMENDNNNKEIETLFNNKNENVNNPNSKVIENDDLKLNVKKKTFKSNEEIFKNNDINQESQSISSNIQLKKSQKELINKRSCSQENIKSVDIKSEEIFPKETKTNQKPLICLSNKHLIYDYDTINLIDNEFSLSVKSTEDLLLPHQIVSKETGYHKFSDCKFTNDDTNEKTNDGNEKSNIIERNLHLLDVDSNESSLVTSLSKESLDEIKSSDNLYEKFTGVSGNAPKTNNNAYPNQVSIVTSQQIPLSPLTNQIEDSKLNDTHHSGNEALCCVAEIENANHIDRLENHRSGEILSTDGQYYNDRNTGKNVCLINNDNNNNRKDIHLSTNVHVISNTDFDNYPNIRIIDSEINDQVQLDSKNTSYSSHDDLLENSSMLNPMLCFFLNKGANQSNLQEQRNKDLILMQQKQCPTNKLSVETSISSNHDSAVICDSDLTSDSQSAIGTIVQDDSFEDFILNHPMTTSQTVDSLFISALSSNKHNDPSEGNERSSLSMENSHEVIYDDTNLSIKQKDCTIKPIRPTEYCSLPIPPRSGMKRSPALQGVCDLLKKTDSELKIIQQQNFTLINDDDLYPDSLTPTKADSTLRMEGSVYNIPYIDDDVFDNDDILSPVFLKYHFKARLANCDECTLASTYDLSINGSLQKFPKIPIVPTAKKKSKTRNKFFRLCGCLSRNRN